MTKIYTIETQYAEGAKTIRHMTEKAFFDMCKYVGYNSYTFDDTLYYTERDNNEFNFIKILEINDLIEEWG
jgi:hypothetical protein